MPSGGGPAGAGGSYGLLMATGWWIMRETVSKRRRSRRLVADWRADAQIFDRHDHRRAVAFARDIPVPVGAHTTALTYSMVGAPDIPRMPTLPCYSFEVPTRHALSGDREDLTLVARGFEKGDAQTPLERRPAVEWSEQ